MNKTARHAHDRISARSGLPRHMVHVLERKARGIDPALEHYMPVKSGRDTLGYAVFGVYNGRPTMKTFLGPHMRPKGQAMKEFRVKSADMIKTGMFDLGVVDAMEKIALSEATMQAVAKARGVPVGYLKQLAKFRAESASMGGQKDLLKRLSSEPRSRALRYSGAFRQRRNASAWDEAAGKLQHGVGRTYFARWLKNKPKARRDYAQFASEMRAKGDSPS